MGQGTRQSSTGKRSTQEKSAPVTLSQPDRDRLPTPEEIDNEAFQQNKFDAVGLQLKQEQGSITPAERIRLGTLQTQMNDFWTQKTSRFAHNFAHVPVQSRSALPIQAKLSIGQPNDRYEQEADRIASQVVDRINASPTASQNATLQRQEISEEDDEDTLQMKSSQQDETIQRQEISEEEDDTLQMKASSQSPRGITATPELEAGIGRSRSGGHPLATNIRKPMETAFGADFSNVRVHTNAQADQLNRSIQAKAFTSAQNIFFRQGAYHPGSRSGQELIAHELTHVVQQGGSSSIQRSQPPKLAGISKTPLLGSVFIQAKNLKPKRPEPITAQEKNSLEKAVREQDVNQFKSLAEKMYSVRPIYYVSLLRYKLAKHKNNDRKRQIWLNYSPTEALHQQSDSGAKTLLDSRLLAPNFNAAPMEPPSKESIFVELKKLTIKNDLSELPTIREYTDFLGQYVSDGLMKSGNSDFLTLKISITKAAVKFQQAFLNATANTGKDYETLFNEGCELINELDQSLITEFQEAVAPHEKLKPNKREVNQVNKGNIDLASMMLAKAAHKGGFAPDMVVGLPSGGAHVASRIAATLASITGKTPLMWLTRPRTVKPERKGLMDDVPEEGILQPAEQKHLFTQLGVTSGQEKPVKILVVDDGQDSGATLKKAIDIYKAAFEGESIPVSIKGGITFGGMTQLADLLFSNQFPEGHENYASFTVLTSYASAGQRQFIDSSSLLPDENELTNNAAATMESQVRIYFNGGVETYAAKDLLTSK